jgi:hypothetical protein
MGAKEGTVEYQGRHVQDLILGCCLLIAAQNGTVEVRTCDMGRTLLLLSPRTFPTPSLSLMNEAGPSETL